MIPRYTRPEMARIWTDQRKYETWLEIELLACEALAELGQIPKEAVKEIRKKASFNAHRVDEIEKVTKHDVLAFLTNVGETIGPLSKYLHYGLTSSDILDTSFAVLLKEASELILQDLRRLLTVLKTMAFQYKDTLMIGRTHGIHAEPITFGLKMALWYDETGRNFSRVERAKDGVSVGKISGAVGTFAHIPPPVEAYVCTKLGLKPAPISTQIVQRDRHAEFFTALAILASSIEKFSVELRHLQRTEVLEVEESFTKGQKGSSAMPHKRNPISSENVSGLARLVRSYAIAALENIPLWHERDISHSSVERVIAPDATILIDYMLNRLTSVIENLIVYPGHMKANLEKTGGLIFSEAVLLLLTRKGLSREEAYAAVQRNAMKVWEGSDDFRMLLSRDPAIGGVVTQEELDAAFDPKDHLRYVDAIFRRVFGGI
ncbi:MAG: adenylosuccinate lyase [Deltaproteobacteria bacterium RBG_13_53_10]|nr:MAG: adenylosuccinate lyase [Deltaproteobacteria bacterium RBG_13_53_10]